MLDLLKFSSSNLPSGITLTESGLVSGLITEQLPDGTTSTVIVSHPYAESKEIIINWIYDNSIPSLEISDAKVYPDTNGIYIATTSDSVIDTSNGFGDYVWIHESNPYKILLNGSNWVIQKSTDDTDTTIYGQGNCVKKGSYILQPGTSEFEDWFCFPPYGVSPSMVRSDALWCKASNNNITYGTKTVSGASDNMTSADNSVQWSTKAGSLMNGTYRFHHRTSEGDVYIRELYENDASFPYTPIYLITAVDSDTLIRINFRGESVTPKMAPALTVS